MLFTLTGVAFNGRPMRGCPVVKAGTLLSRVESICTTGLLFVVASASASTVESSSKSGYGCQLHACTSILGFHNFYSCIPQSFKNWHSAGSEEPLKLSFGGPVVNSLLGFLLLQELVQLSLGSNEFTPIVRVDLYGTFSSSLESLKGGETSFRY